MLVLTLMSCAHTPTPEPAAVEPAPAAEAAPDLEPQQLHMEQHYLATADAVEGALRGDLPRAREQLAWLAEHPPQTSIPVDWWPAIERMQGAARAGGAADDFVTLGLAVGEVGAACGQCHRDQGAQVDFGPPPPPPDGTGSVNHMARHAWGLDRMWEALITSDAGLWRDGAAMLAQEGPSYAHTGGHEEGDQESLLMAAELHQVASDALGAPLDRRANAFGQVLARCASCHTRNQGGPASVITGPPDAP